MDWVGAIAVTQNCTAVLLSTDYLKLELLSLSWRLDQSSLEHEGGSHDGSVHFREVFSDSFVDNDLEVLEATTVVELYKAEISR